MIQVQLAKHSDIDWINNKYKEIGFVPCNSSKDLITIATINGEQAGLGRLVHIDGQHTELGGIYVFETFRNQGAAHAIVSFLLSHETDYQIIYCLPFEHLIRFYESFGFKQCNDHDFIPEDIKNKHRWCNQTYPYQTLLLQLIKNPE